MSDFPLDEMVRFVADESRLFDPDNSPFRVTYREGSEGPNAKVCVIVGENASGKSLFFRVLATRAQVEHKLLPITISIRERTGSGMNDMAGLRRSFMFGDETTSSTGAASAKVVKNGFHNANRETPALLMLDEPEIGLSEGYARALGKYIIQQAEEASETCRGVVVVTHSRALVDSMFMFGRERPIFVHLGDTPKTTLEWLEEIETRSVEDLLNLGDLSLERFRATQAILNSKD